MVIVEKKWNYCRVCKTRCDNFNPRNHKCNCKHYWFVHSIKSLEEKLKIIIDGIELNPCSWDIKPDECPNCGNQEIDSDYIYHDKDMRFISNHYWVCYECLESEMIHCTNPWHRAKHDDRFKKHLIKINFSKIGNIKDYKQGGGGVYR